MTNQNRDSLNAQQAFAGLSRRVADGGGSSSDTGIAKTIADRLAAQLSKPQTDTDGESQS